MTENRIKNKNHGKRKENTPRSTGLPLERKIQKYIPKKYALIPTKIPFTTVNINRISLHPPY
jgi:hypothetical protein